MEVYKIYPVGFASNCYLVTADGKTAVAIDPAQPRVLERARALGLEIGYALLTHGHFDHVGGCAALRAAGAKVGCLSAERRLAEKNNLAREFGSGSDFPPVHIDFTFENGQTLSLCGISFTVIATPGHTAGGAAYLAERTLFTGDTLFAGSVGRVDLPTGSAAALEASVRRLYALEGDFLVRPGHGEDTTLEAERRGNPYIRL